MKSDKTGVKRSLCTKLEALVSHLGVGYFIFFVQQLDRHQFDLHIETLTVFEFSCLMTV